MSVSIFLQVDGIPGESMVKGFENWIQLKTFEFGGNNTWTTNPMQTGYTPGGAQAGKVSLAPFQFTKIPDAASGGLFSHMCTGQHIQKVTMAVTKASGALSGSTYMKILLTDVVIINWVMSLPAGPDETPVETVTLTFSKVEFTYLKQTATGNLVSTGPKSWDVAANKAS